MLASGENRVPPASPPYTGQSRGIGCARSNVDKARTPARYGARFMPKILFRIPNLRLRQGYGGPRRSAAREGGPNPQSLTNLLLLASVSRCTLQHSGPLPRLI